VTGPRKGLFQRGRHLGGFWRPSALRAIVVTSRPALARRFAMLRTRALLRLLAASIVLGCATNKPFDRTTEPGGRPLSQTTAGSVILTGEDLSANPGWTVLDAIRRAMPQVKISTGRGLNPCPLIHNGVVRSVLLVKCCAATAASRFALFSTASLSEYGRRSGILVSTALGPGTSAGTPVRRTSVHPSMPCKNSDTHFW